MATSQQVRSDLTRALAAWSVLSIGVGAVLAVRGGGGRSAGVARQFLAWGGIDLAVAGLGRLARRGPATDAAAATTSLRRLLLVNSGLDVGYVVAGAALVRSRRVRGRDCVGDGAAVVVQGVFLLLLDLTGAARLRTTPS